MKTKLFILAILLPLIGLSQGRERTLLRGHVVSDSTVVQDLDVHNMSSHRGTVTDNRGYFIMFARANDTLFFNSMPFRPTYVVLTAADMAKEPFTIHLDVNITVLDEVIVSDLTGELGTDSKNRNIKTLTPQIDEATLKYPYPISKRPLNTALPNTESQLQGVDFIAIKKMIFKPKKRKKDNGEIFDKEAPRTFTETAINRFTDYFFTETLHIPGNEIALFLAYCDKGKETTPLLDPRREFELTDYLVKQADAYLKQKK